MVAEVSEEEGLRVEFEEFERCDEGRVELKFGKASNAGTSKGKVFKEREVVCLRDDPDAAFVEFECVEVWEDVGNVDFGNGGGVACWVRKVDAGEGEGCQVEEGGTWRDGRVKEGSAMMSCVVHEMEVKSLELCSCQLTRSARVVTKRRKID